jgi:hypothetical protein
VGGELAQIEPVTGQVQTAIASDGDGGLFLLADLLRR